ncbi:uncharacterized protein LOC127264684 [Andrographis paniculata]|uniref:uncharacterized protein LOC127264684 n=1 Tax=Andrographis paniculata TaxID=175694 RepID=UPI0021E970FD|nr:uncharacterized protein LOC127264684 [Andrographis paniculata]
MLNFTSSSPNKSQISSTSLQIQLIAQKLEIGMYETAPALPFDGSNPSPNFIASEMTTPAIRPLFGSMAASSASGGQHIFKDGRSLAINTPNFDPIRLYDGIKTLPPNVKDYKDWYRRVSKEFGQQWKKQGIDKAILFSTSSFHIQEEFLTAMASFWDSDNNVFLLPDGPIAPTLLDVAVIANLPIVGEDPVLGALALSTEEPPKNHPGYNLLTTKIATWNKYLQAHRPSYKSAVSEEEHVAFLLYWLNRYVQFGM